MVGQRTLAARTGWAIVAAVLLLGTARAAGPDDELPPLDEEQRRILAAIPADPRPRALVRGNHYVVSNEDRPHLFHDAVAGLGGVLVGVGAEQNYVFAGWARSEILVLMDFDQLVVDLHRVYAAVLRQAETPEDFVAWWSPGNERSARRLLKRISTSKDDRRALLGAYRVARRSTYRRLRWLRRAYRRETPCFLTDPAQYAHVAGLVRAGRVFPVRGDLTQRGTLAAIGGALRRIGRSVRVLYLSNAEEYFSYNDAFRSSIRELPADEQSLVLRTSPRDYDGYYRYHLQGLVEFQSWMDRPAVDRIRQIRRRKTRSGHRDRYRLPGPPPTAPPAGAPAP